MTEKKLTYSSKTISAGNNAKTVKGDKKYLTAIMYMAPWKALAGFNACAMAELAQCHVACLYTAGRGQMTNVQNSRLAKTQRFVEDRDKFMRGLIADIERFVNYCTKNKVKPAIRLNGTSDIRWETIKVDGKTVFELFPKVQFYDYTKIANRDVSHISNYDLTWSYSNANPKYEQMWKDARCKGMNIAVVFRNKADIPTEFLGLPTEDGDRDDLRFLDPRDCVIALYAKGAAKKDQTGFVV